MRILSLGAGGFIGCHLTQRLLNEGHAVTAVDIEADKASDFIDHPGLTFIRQDIRAPGWSLEPLVRDADLVIDLIAYANPGLYLRIPLDVFQLNFIENLKIAESCVKRTFLCLECFEGKYRWVAKGAPRASLASEHERWRFGRL